MDTHMAIGQGFSITDSTSGADITVTIAAGSNGIPAEARGVLITDASGFLDGSGVKLDLQVIRNSVVYSLDQGYLDATAPAAKRAVSWHSACGMRISFDEGTIQAKLAKGGASGAGFLTVVGVWF